MGDKSPKNAKKANKQKVDAKTDKARKVKAAAAAGATPPATR